MQICNKWQHSLEQTPFNTHAHLSHYEQPFENTQSIKPLMYFEQNQLKRLKKKRNQAKQLKDKEQVCAVPSTMACKWSRMGLVWTFRGKIQI